MFGRLKSSGDVFYDNVNAELLNYILKSNDNDESYVCSFLTTIVFQKGKKKFELDTDTPHPTE